MKKPKKMMGGGMAPQRQYTNQQLASHAKKEAKSAVQSGTARSQLAGAQQAVQAGVGRAQQAVGGVPRRMKAGGKVDGVARRGKTKGRMC
jgi:hypothetical protein